MKNYLRLCYNIGSLMFLNTSRFQDKVLMKYLYVAYRTPVVLQHNKGSIIKGIWFQRWNKNKWRYGISREGARRGKRRCKVIPVGLTLSLCPVFLRSTRAKRIVFVMAVKLFETRSRGRFNNILTKVFRI